MKSRPFDCGNTIGTALQSGINKPDKEIAKTLQTTARAFNAGSQSNGAIMKITPLAIWCCHLSLDDIIPIVNQEVSLTHSSEVVKQAAVIYCYAIKLLLNGQSMKDTYQIIDEYIKSGNGIEDNIKEWWGVIEREELMNGTPRMGWIKIAWTYAFIFLKKQMTDYLEILRQVLSKGGDTDTNACIVGGLIGAAIGYENLPKKQIDILLQCDCSKSIKKREEFFNPKAVIPLIEKIIEIAPKQQIIKPQETFIQQQTQNEQQFISYNIGFNNLFDEDYIQPQQQQEDIQQKKPLDNQEQLKQQQLEEEENYKGLLCHKCKAKNPEQIFRNFSTCNKCYEIQVTSKLKSALKNKLNLLTNKQNNPSNFLICVSGRADSLALAKMISDTIFSNSQKKMYISAEVLHIDESVLYQLTPEQSNKKIQKLQQFCTELKFKLNIIKLEDIFSLELDSTLTNLFPAFKPLPITQQYINLPDSQKLINLFKSLQNSSCKYDLIQNFKHYLILNYLLKSNYNTALLGISGQRLSQIIFQQICKGQGYNIIEDSQFLQLYRVGGREVRVGKPLKELDGEELENYVKLKKLEDIGQYFEKKKDTQTGNLNLTLQNFINTMQSQQKNTIFNINGTSDKIVFKHNCFEKNEYFYCPICLNMRDKIVSPLELKTETRVDQKIENLLNADYEIKKLFIQQQEELSKKQLLTQKQIICNHNIVCFKCRRLLEQSCEELIGLLPVFQQAAIATMVDKFCQMNEQQKIENLFLVEH